jgi:undecaprenyl-diphosphatase
MLLTHWLDSIGLSLELVIIVGALVLTAGFVLLHSWKPILLWLAPYLGNTGRWLQERLRKPKPPAAPPVQADSPH